MELALRLAAQMKTMRQHSRHAVVAWLSAAEAGVDADLTLHTGRNVEASLTMGRDARRAG